MHLPLQNAVSTSAYAVMLSENMLNGWYSHSTRLQGPHVCGWQDASQLHEHAEARERQLTQLAGFLIAHSDTLSAVQLRGALRGCTAPIQVSALRKSLEMGGTAGPASQVITPIIDELAAEGSVQGRLQGGGSSWIPAAHSRRQQEAVTSFYQQNGFVGCALGFMCLRQGAVYPWPEAHIVPCLNVLPAFIRPSHRLLCTESKPVMSLAQV